jgi:hypothetical protein
VGQHARRAAAIAAAPILAVAVTLAVGAGLASASPADADAIFEHHGATTRATATMDPAMVAMTVTTAHPQVMLCELMFRVALPSQGHPRA